MEDNKYLSLAELREKRTRKPSAAEVQGIKENLKVLETRNGFLAIPDGISFVKNLRKEANRQKSMAACENFELQTKAIDEVPCVPTAAAECRLADTFEIIEE